MILLLLCLVSLITFVQTQNTTFPDDFKFGVATASYQIEGAWNEDGKGENIWDRLTHEHPDWVVDKNNGDIACDSYHKIEEDVKLLRWFGVDFYRFSLSWTRLLPSGYTNQINHAGIQYYNDLINELLKYNITPMVTLYHWDLPQSLQEIGGWPNPLLADYYEDYVRIAFESFGDRVKFWITFNEPSQTCQSGYGDGDDAPAYHSNGIGTYLCGKTLLLAHARAYHLYKREFRAKQKGKIGITINSIWAEPKTNSSVDIEAAETTMQMILGWWAHPIFSKTGDYPTKMKQRIDANSKEESFPRSRLPEFTADEVKVIKGTFDFFGLNHYSTWMVQSVNVTPKWIIPSFAKDIGVQMYQDPSWPSSAAPWLKVVPWGLRKLLNWIKNEYDNPLLYITENGYADTDGVMTDNSRINYYNEYLKNVLKAIQLDGCNVKAYTAWSLMDNFEWRQGYTQRFGLVYVNFKNASRPRTPKLSAHFYKSIINKRNLDLIPNVKIV